MASENTAHNNMTLDLSRYERALADIGLSKDIGKVTEVRGYLVRGYIPGACLGSLCEIHTTAGSQPFLAEVVGFQDRSVLLMPLGEMKGVGLGSKIVLIKSHATIPMSRNFLGRVINPLCEPMDDLGPIESLEELSLYSEGSNPLSRPPIDEVLSLGVRSIDSMITVGKGQRVGILAGSGVGKSVLLGMMAKNTSAEVNVIALIGERGREVREFVEHTLGEEGLRKSVIVCATSDQSPLLRMRGAFVAASIAEFFCAQGKDVLFMMDSVTRFAMAQREIGLNIGEPPSTKGYTPSVFSMLPKVLERAGRFEGQGSITGLYTVLVEGDDPDDPIGDAVRSIVDGHIVLDRSMAEKGHFPAINVLKSTSRVMRGIVSKEHMQRAQLLRSHLAVYMEAEDLINIGAYRDGSNPKIDEAIKWHDSILNFLKQDLDEPASFEDTVEAMGGLGSSR